MMSGEASAMSDVDVPQASSEDPVPATPPPGPAPGPEDLLGLRVAAALIDLALLAGILAILSAAVGQANVSGGNFSVYLTGTWALVFLALALGYYFEGYSAGRVEVQGDYG